MVIKGQMKYQAVILLNGMNNTLRPGGSPIRSPKKQKKEDAKSKCSKCDND